MLCLLSPPYQWLKLTDVNTGDAFASTKRTGTGMRFPKVPEDSWRSIRNSRWRSSSRRSTKDWLQWAEAARHAPRSFGCLTFRQGLPLSHSLQATFMMTYCSMACDEWARSKISKAVDHGIPWPYHVVYMDMLQHFSWFHNFHHSCRKLKSGMHIVATGQASFILWAEDHLSDLLSKLSEGMGNDSGQWMHPDPFQPPQICKAQPFWHPPPPCHAASHNLVKSFTDFGQIPHTHPHHCNHPNTERDQKASDRRHPHGNLSSN